MDLGLCICICQASVPRICSKLEGNVTVSHELQRLMGDLVWYEYDLNGVGVGVDDHPMSQVS